MESACSTPSHIHRHSGSTIAEPAMAASTCSQRPCRRAIAAMSSIGSTAVLVVVPVVATTAQGTRPACAIRGNGLARARRPHRPIRVERIQPQMVAAEAGEQRGLLDRAVAVRRRVDDERRGSGLQPASREAVVGRALARAEQRDERAGGRGVLNDAAPGRQTAEHLTKPVGRDFFDFGQRRTRLPRQAEHAQARAREVAQHAREIAVAGEVAEERRMRPVRETRDDDRVEVAHDVVERFGRLGRRRRQPGLDLARRVSAPSRVARHARPIVRDPVDQLMTMAPEFFRGHRPEHHDMKRQRFLYNGAAIGTAVCSGRGQ